MGPTRLVPNLTPDLTNYLAWFAPGERGLLDQRVGLFGAVAPDFVTVHRNLGRDDAGPAEDRDQAGPRASWRRILHDRGVPRSSSSPPPAGSMTW